MIYWEARNGETATISYRKATNLGAAVRSARCYWRDKLHCDGVILYRVGSAGGGRSAPGACFRRDENGAATGHKWVVRNLPVRSGEWKE